MNPMVHEVAMSCSQAPHPGEGDAPQAFLLPSRNDSLTTNADYSHLLACKYLKAGKVIL